MRRELRDRVAVITGASSGIGRAAALAFAREGVQVVLGARRADRLQEAVEAIQRAGGKARALQTDVTQPGDVKRLVDEAVAAFGRLDIQVNNAGLGYFGRLESMSLEEVRHLFEVNVMGTIYGIQAAVPIMRSQRSGHIINISSVLGKRATPGSAVYAATKFAQVALSESLRLELADAGIDVSVICPVSTTTEFFAVATARSPMKHDPAGPVYSAEQVAEIILRCARRPRAEVMVYPPVRLMVVLNAVWPGLMDRVLAVYWKRMRSRL
ncbi:MAG: SDR family NAD(P)-dependent oxidoreductase [Candidatus Methylomirabilales bacterium]